MAKFLLIHRHEAEICETVHAAWSGFDSPLLPGRPPATCRQGGHVARWIVRADDGPDALALLPDLVARHTDAIKIG